MIKYIFGFINQISFIYILNKILFQISHIHFSFGKRKNYKTSFKNKKKEKKCLHMINHMTSNCIEQEINLKRVIFQQ